MVIQSIHVNNALSSAERQQTIHAFGVAHQDLTAALVGFPRAMWHFRPAPDEWSIHEILVHLADVEAHIYCRLRWAIAQPGAMIAAYDQSVWAVALHYLDQSCEDALNLFRFLRQMSARLIEGLPMEVWTHTVEHPENGTMTMDDLLVFYTDHTAVHIQQMEACYQAWQRTERGARVDARPW